MAGGLKMCAAPLNGRAGFDVSALAPGVYVIAAGEERVKFVKR
jgi:hypothetical protein